MSKTIQEHEQECDKCREDSFNRCHEGFAIVEQQIQEQYSGLKKDDYAS